MQGRTGETEERAWEESPIYGAGPSGIRMDRCRETRRTNPRSRSCFETGGNTEGGGHRQADIAGEPNQSPEPHGDQLPASSNVRMSLSNCGGTNSAADGGAYQWSVAGECV